MKKLKKQRKLYFLSDKEPLSILEFGKYEIGMEFKEIEEYFGYRIVSFFPNCSQKELNQIVKFMVEIFNGWCKGQTCGVSPEGKCLIYRWDIERFLAYYLEDKETYFD